MERLGRSKDLESMQARATAFQIPQPPRLMLQYVHTHNVYYVKLCFWLSGNDPSSVCYSLQTPSLH